MAMYIYMGCKGRASEGFFSDLWITSFSMFLWVWIGCNNVSNNSWNCILFHRMGGDKQPINSCQQVFGNVLLLENNRWFLLQFCNSLKIILIFVAAFKSPIILYKICLLPFFCRGNTYSVAHHFVCPLLLQKGQFWHERKYLLMAGNRLKIR